MRCTQTTESGAYVLGALAPAERAAYERHLSGCAACSAEVAQIAGLPGLLRRLDPGTAASIGQPESAPPALLETMLTDARSRRLRERRRHRWQRSAALLVAACLAVVVGVGVGLLGGGASASTKPVVAVLTPVDRDTPIAAVVSYWPKQEGGTALTMACVYSDSVHYTGVAHLDLWVFPRDGRPGRSVWGWDAGPGDRISFWAQSSLRPDQIGRLEIRNGTTALLVYTAT
jgi:predicted anti-sigma-YlaC factor YlaD